jgi:hypothetical protein
VLTNSAVLSQTNIASSIGTATCPVITISTLATAALRVDCHTTACSLLEPAKNLDRLLGLVVLFQMRTIML